MNLSEAVSKRLSELMSEKGINAYKLSIAGGLPRSTLSVIINAKNKTIKLDTINEICETLRITVREFFNSPLFDDIID